jgi:hypothetical protein
MRRLSVDKFGRNYQLVIEKKNGDDLVVTLPLSLDFDITRNILSSSNTATFRVYNLNENNQNQLRKNQYDWATFRTVQLQAGYGTSQLPICFNGTLGNAWTTREGTADVTQLDCYDGGFALTNGILNQNFPKGSTQSQVMEGIISTSLPNVTLGKIGSFNTKLSRGNSYSGTTGDVLNDLSGGAFFIDNNKAHVLKDNECLKGSIALIDSSTGLLSTPILEDTFLRLEILFEPRLLIGQIINLQSLTYPKVNGTYKIVSIRHSGTISAAICGDARTTVGLAYGLGDLVIVP